MPHSASGSKSGSAEERKLEQEAQIPRSSDGKFNTIMNAERPGYIWRVSRGIDEKMRKKHLNDWLEEVSVLDIVAKLGIAPHIEREYAKGSWLTDERFRVAILQEKFSLDLHDALFGGGARWQGRSLVQNERFGTSVGIKLVHRMRQMGALCMVHGDLKPENVVVLLSGRHAEPLVGIIDFDPQYLFVGCGCMNARVSALWPHMPGVNQRKLIKGFFSRLNALLLWTWFEVFRLRHHSFENYRAARACHAELQRYLSAREFPLDLMASHMPQELRDLLEHWTRSYCDTSAKVNTFAPDVPIWLRAGEMMPNLLRGESREHQVLHNHDELQRNPGDKGCEELFGASASVGEDCGRDVQRARERLLHIASGVSTMTCRDKARQ